MFQAASKLLAFKARIESGEDVSGQKIATPFMLFAVNTEGSQVSFLASKRRKHSVKVLFDLFLLKDMVQLEHLFKQSIAENADQFDDLDSVATQPQETQIVEVSNAVGNGIIDDQSGAFLLRTQPEQVTN